MTATPDVELKGAGFYGLLACVEKLHGADARAAAIASLPAELAEKLRTRTLLVGAWYRARGTAPCSRASAPSRPSATTKRSYARSAGRPRSST